MICIYCILDKDSFKQFEIGREIHGLTETDQIDFKLLKKKKK